MLFSWCGATINSHASRLGAVEACAGPVLHNEAWRWRCRCTRRVCCEWCRWFFSPAKILRFCIFGLRGSVLFFFFFFFLILRFFKGLFIFFPPSPSEERIFDFDLLGLWNASSLLYNVASKFPKLNVCNSQRFYGCCVELTTWHSPGRSSHFRSFTAEDLFGLGMNKVYI